MPLLACVLLASLYAVAYLALKQTGMDSFEYVVKRIPSVKLYGMGTATELQEYAKTWGAVVGVALGVVAMIVGYILYGIAAIIRLTKFPWVASLISILSISPFMILGYILDNTTPHTAISAALVYFIGTPIWYGALGTIAILFVLFLLSFRYATPASAPATI